MSKAFVSSGRSTLIALAVACAFCVLLGRLFYLHVWDQAELLEFVEGNRKMVKVVEARRGNIVDARGNLLATTRTTYNIGVDPQSIRDTDLEKLPELSRILGVPLNEIEAKLAQKTRKVSADSKEIRLIR